MATETVTEPLAVVTEYFEALKARDADRMAACWASDGVEHIASMFDGVGPDAVRAYFSAIFAAIPDIAFEIESYTAQDDRVAVHWHASGTFAGPGQFDGIEPTGDTIALEGLDLLRVAGGKLVRNDAYADGMGFARQLGMLPPKGSKGEQRMTKAFNAKTKATRRAISSGLEDVAPGVYLLRGGFPLKAMNVYFIEEPDGSGVVMFDAGIAMMTKPLAAAGASLGGITRIVLGHAHADHRGAAAGLSAPVFIHPADRADAESDGGEHYFDYAKLGRPARWTYPRLLPQWDGGPVKIAGTVEEGDEIAGFRVVHLPGHAPGLIGLFRDSDRVALTSDCFYTINPETGIKGDPRLPHVAFNWSTDEARASIRKLAELNPTAAWPGHAEPVTGDVREQLLRAADA